MKKRLKKSRSTNREEVQLKKAKILWKVIILKSYKGI